MYVLTLFLQGVFIFLFHVLRSEKVSFCYIYTCSLTFILTHGNCTGCLIEVHGLMTYGTLAGLITSWSDSQSRGHVCLEIISS